MSDHRTGSIPVLGIINAPIAQLDRVSDYESEGCRFDSCWVHISGMWLSLVEHLVWDQGVAGSNPVFPIYNLIVIVVSFSRCSSAG